MMQQITSFELLYPHVHKKGVFITEDATTSYHPMASTYRKGSLPQGVPYFETPQETFITHMKFRVDYINGYWINPKWAPSDPFVTSIDSIAFYDGMVVVEKRPHPHPTQERRGTDEIPYCAPGQTNGCLSEAIPPGARGTSAGAGYRRSSDSKAHRETTTWQCVSRG